MQARLTDAIILFCSTVTIRFFGALLKNLQNIFPPKVACERLYAKGSSSQVPLFLRHVTTKVLQSKNRGQFSLLFKKHIFQESKVASNFKVLKDMFGCITNTSK